MNITIIIEDNNENITHIFEDYESAIDFLAEEGDIYLDSESAPYDCQDMPKNVRDEFFQMHNAGNDCYVNHYITDPNNIVDKYFIELGESVGDCIIVKHWW